jgi:hypothetical protein
MLALAAATTAMRDLHPLHGGGGLLVVQLGALELRVVPARRPDDLSFGYWLTAAGDVLRVVEAAQA